MADFIHLHNHTHYSLQDGACTVQGLINAAKENNMPSVALTDHGVMYGIADFLYNAPHEGIKPIVGMEAYIVLDGSRFDKAKNNDHPSRKRNYYHLILLAKNDIGYKNLTKLSSLGFLEGFYYKPRIDIELLKKYKEGLVCTSACAGGVVSAFLINNDYQKAKETAIIFKEIFGDDFYLEIQDHNLEVEKAVLENVPKLSRELNIKMVATNDCHYIKQDHSIAHNILLLLSDKEGKDYRQLRYGTDQIYFKSEAEMKKLFKNYKGAIENTLEIDEKITYNPKKVGYHFPVFPIPESSPAKTLDGYFELLARKGLEEKFNPIEKDVEDRFNFEINTIKSMGFSGYFLIVQDFINSSKTLGVDVGPGRGSAAGSLVAYCLGITAVNPLEYDLLFERFLNPARKSMPDIDVDFADDRRSRVIDYVRERYGNSNVCQIITFNRLSSKAVLKDVARVLKIPIQTVGKITKFIPSEFGKVYSIEKALDVVPELKWVNESKDENIKELIKYSKILEGMNRNSSKHAAGVVIAPGEVSEFIPVAVVGSENEVVTQFNMKEVEKAGLLKMDFLGLRTLSIIRDAVELIERTQGVKVDINTIPEDDEKTFQLFSKGQTTGVFQFESGPMREYLKRLNPSSIKDLAAMNALYRPGPMKYIDDFIECKFGRQKVKYLHPLLEPILKETYGIIVYQEQVIQIANKVAGMSLSEADILRRAMGKKDLKAMAEQKSYFIESAIKNNVDGAIAGKIFDVIEEFANYGFNKSHAVAYSVVAYRTAYLKAHYTAEFLAANMTNEFTNTNKITDLLDDCRKSKIVVLPPDVNTPCVAFNVENGKILFGMSAIKNVGTKAVLEIIRSREALGRNYTSIFDFCSNVDTRVVNKRVMEGLVLAGAFDNINTHRLQLFKTIELALDFGSKVQSSKISAENSLFGEMVEEISFQEPPLPKVEPWNETEKLSKERQVLGFYVTGHPLKKYDMEVSAFSSVKLGETEELGSEEFIKVCGVITDITTKIDKSNRMMAFFKLEDFSGSCECMMFSKNYEKFGQHVKEENCVFVTGKPESSGDAIKLQIEEIIPLETVRENYIDSIGINFYTAKYGIETLKKLNRLIEKNEGNIPVYVKYLQNGDTPICYLIEHKTLITTQLMESLREIFDEDDIVLKGKGILSH